MQGGPQMAIMYQCRHCKEYLAELSHEFVDTNQLGLEELSEEDQLQMIRYHENGNIQIDTICEHCQEALEKNPHYHELDFFLQ